MEIERKWMVKGWPEAELPLLYEEEMRQGYISVDPTVRIRSEAVKGGKTSWVLCIKSRGGLAREEIEIEIPEETFQRLSAVAGYPLIPKTRRTYQLPDGHHLEVNHVDEGMPTEFWYAEIEYATVREAMDWMPPEGALAGFLKDEVTGQPGQTMGAFWVQTRVKRMDKILPDVL